MIDPRALMLALGMHLTGSDFDEFAYRVKLLHYACHDIHAPCAVVYAVADVESGYRMRGARSLMGCQPYGSPDWQQARCGAQSIVTSLRICGTLNRALTRYVSPSGTCTTTRRWRRRAAHYVATVHRIMNRIGGVRD